MFVGGEALAQQLAAVQFADVEGARVGFEREVVQRVAFAREFVAFQPNVQFVAARPQDEDFRVKAVAHEHRAGGQDDHVVAIGVGAAGQVPAALQAAVCEREGFEGGRAFFGVRVGAVVAGADVEQAAFFVDAAALRAHQPAAAGGDEGLGGVGAGADAVNGTASHAGDVEVARDIEDDAFGMGVFRQGDVCGKCGGDERCEGGSDEGLAFHGFSVCWGSAHDRRRDCAG